MLCFLYGDRYRACMYNMMYVCDLGHVMTLHHRDKVIIILLIVMVVMGGIACNYAFTFNNLNLK